MKKSNLIIILLLLLSISCNNETKVIEEIGENETLFRGYVIEIDENHGQDNEEDECPDCEEIFEDKINNGVNPSGTCFSGTTSVLAGKNYLYKLAVGSTTTTEATWNVSEGMEILHIEFDKREKYTISYCVIKYKENFIEGYIEANAVLAGGVGIPIKLKN